MLLWLTIWFDLLITQCFDFFYAFLRVISNDYLYNIRSSYIAVINVHDVILSQRMISMIFAFNLASGMLILF
jgi:hypothetical protein